ncbi:esterase/lipase/thioesterase [Cutibacterium acnes JCM 18920]|nr:esterase/lipase/thioesterase [Cutibacterium acnes JCM 18920]
MEHRRTMPATLRWFSDHGWLVIRPSYTLATQATPPGILHQNR